MKCCICDNEIVGRGNNPAPVKGAYSENGGRCCDSCNGLVVLPVRMVDLSSLVDAEWSMTSKTSCVHGEPGRCEQCAIESTD